MHKRSEAEIRQLISAEAGSQKSGSRKFPKSAHQIYEYLHLAAALGANPEPLPPHCLSRRKKSKRRRKNSGWRRLHGPVFGLNPGAEYGPAKRWPVEKFIAAAKEIQQRTNCAWILFGGKSDVAIDRSKSNPPSASGNPAILNLAGKTSLRELMSLLKLCRVLLTNDTGPMHVAAALGTPVVCHFRQHVAGIDRAGFAGRCAPSFAEIRRALLALFSARMSD